MTVPSLINSLSYSPVPLKFGTSGRRGKVADLSQLEIYINARAEIQYLQCLYPEEGGVRAGDEFFIAHDLRPSSVSMTDGRGQIAQAITQAILDADMTPVNLGAIPTPALTAFALSKKRGSMMITGSHIPFDRNGYKTNSAIGELLKTDETPIDIHVRIVRRRLYDQPFHLSPFDANGNFKTPPKLPTPIDNGRDFYIQRYTDFLSCSSLEGIRVLAYQHSAVGRDLFVKILQLLGAEVLPTGRSEQFVPIDTEAIGDAELASIQSLVNEAWRRHGPFQAVVSTDGDSDRPLFLGVTPPASKDESPKVHFFPGDLLGLIVARWLNADAVVVPISSNDAIDLSDLGEKLQPKTRIGSPFVIAGMLQAKSKGLKTICGWEANGGFLVGSEITRENRVLPPLPTRDAMLPLIAVLNSANHGKRNFADLFDALPKRYGKSSLLRNFPREKSLQILKKFTPSHPTVNDVLFNNGAASVYDNSGQLLNWIDYAQCKTIKSSLEKFFPADSGFTNIIKLNYTDGLRIYFDNNEVAHIRPSGNADELRIYALADTQSRANQIAALGVAEPDGILRKLEREA